MRSSLRTIAKAHDIGDDVRRLLRAENQVRHARVRSCEEDMERGRRHPRGVGDIPEIGTDDESPWGELFRGDEMAGCANFAGEGYPALGLPTPSCAFAAAAVTASAAATKGSSGNKRAI